VGASLSDLRFAGVDVCRSPASMSNAYVSHLTVTATHFLFDDAVTATYPHTPRPPLQNMNQERLGKMTQEEMSSKDDF
jgi:hypothetical protein